MKTKTILIALGFIAVAGIASQLIQSINKEPSSQPVTEAMVSKKVSPFSLPDLDGVEHSISQWAGKVIVLNFWATWCPPCRKETPMFVELQEQWGPQGLQFVGIAIDEKSKVKDFVDTYGVNYPVLIGVDDAIAIAKAYGNRFGALPYTVFIDRNGHIAHVQRGELPRETAEETIKSLL